MLLLIGSCSEPIKAQGIIVKYYADRCNYSLFEIKITPKPLHLITGITPRGCNLVALKNTKIASYAVLDRPNDSLRSATNDHPDITRYYNFIFICNANAHLRHKPEFTCKRCLRALQLARVIMADSSMSQSARSKSAAPKTSHKCCAAALCTNRSDNGKKPHFPRISERFSTHDGMMK